MHSVKYSVSMSSEQKELKPKSSLRENPLKRALEIHIVEPTLVKYLVCSVRCLLKRNFLHNDFYEKRKVIQQNIKSINEVAGFFDCITTMPSKKKDEKFDIGFAYWIIYQFSECQMQKIENLISRKIFECNVEISNLKPIKSRGKMKLLFFL